MNGHLEDLRYYLIIKNDKIEKIFRTFKYILNVQINMKHIHNAQYIQYLFYHEIRNYLNIQYIYIHTQYYPGEYCIYIYKLKFFIL